MQETLQDLLWRLFKDKFIDLVFSGVVVSVDKNKNTCTIKPEGDKPEIYDVRLMAIIDEVQNKLIVYPKQNSIALVCLIDNRQTEAIVLAVSEVESFHLKADEIVFNGGDLKGLPKVEALTGRLNVIENKLNEVINAVKSHTHTPVPPNGTTPVSVQLSGLSLINPITQLSDIENAKIKQ